MKNTNIFSEGTLNASVTASFKLLEQRLKWVGIGGQNQTDVRVGNGIGHLLDRTLSTAPQAVRSNSCPSAFKVLISQQLKHPTYVC